MFTTSNVNFKVNFLNINRIWGKYSRFHLYSCRQNYFSIPKIVKFQDTFISLRKLKILRLDDNKLKVDIFYQILNIRQFFSSPHHLLISELKMKIFSFGKNIISKDINGLLTAQNELKKLNVSSNRLMWFDYAFIPKASHQNIFNLQSSMSEHIFKVEYIFFSESGGDRPPW